MTLNTSNSIIQNIIPVPTRPYLFRNSKPLSPPGPPLERPLLRRLQRHTTTAMMTTAPPATPIMMITVVERPVIGSTENFKKYCQSAVSDFWLAKGAAIRLGNVQLT